MTEPVPPMYALAHVAPDFLESLSPVERFVLPYLHGAWLRPVQVLPTHNWRSCGFIGGRGLGKSHGIACNVNQEIAAGRIKSLGLMAPTIDRVKEVQAKFLIDTAPPWFRPWLSGESLVYPNGVVCEFHSPEKPGRSRSSNFDAAWLTELVDWQPTTMMAAFKTITTATRVGRAQFIWDTTSQGINELIIMLEDLATADPINHVLRRGSMFDNPLLSRKYLASECAKYGYGGDEYDEEVLGLVKRAQAGALWTPATLTKHRRAVRPLNPELTILGVDPGLTEDARNDESGIVIADRGRDGHVYVHTDESGHHGVDKWPAIVVDWCDGTRGEASGLIIERNHAGDLAAAPVQSEARTRGMLVERLDLDEPFPERRPGVIYLKEVHAVSSKSTRAKGPAAETNAGRVHIVDVLKELERQLTTYVPGTRKSPNRFDAFVYVVTELAGLEHDQPGAVRESDARQAEALHTQLMTGLIASARGERVGL